MTTLIPVVTLPASLTVNEADEALAVYRPDTVVAIRSDRRGGTDWYAFVVAALVDRLLGASGDVALEGILELSSAEALSAVETGDPRASQPSFRGVVVWGREAIGLTFDPRTVEEAPRPRTRSWRPESPESPMPESDLGPAPPPAGAPAPPPTTRSGAPPPAPPPPAAEPQAPAPPGGDEPREPSGGGGPAETLAHPRLDAPERVDPGSRFEVVVGVASTAQEGLSGGPMTIRTDQPEIAITIQLTGDGLEFPEGIRRTLQAHRDRLDEAMVTVPVVAPDGDLTTRLEAAYSHEGVPIGRAWREITVGAADLASHVPDTGSLPIDLSGGTGPDLTVTVVEGMSPGRYLWTFASPHDLDIPDHQVVGPVVADTRSFALGHVKELARTDGSDLAEQTVTGISRMVSRAAPNEFWNVLDQVWRLVQTVRSETPSVLMVSDERFIPWELASTEPDWVDPGLLLADTPRMLGAQVSLGRWLPAGPSTPRGTPRPAVPPTDRISIDRFALVVGDYLAEMGQRPLPMAKEEGDRLAERYPHVRLGATAPEVRALLADELTEDGRPLDVQVIHFACHGEVDPNNPAYNGIVLSDSALRLDHITVAGSSIGRNDQPIVFLNACQLAHDTGDLLGDYGGLAGAFLTEGCRGFVAALWSVNDIAARDIALDFYRMTIEEGITAGEALRRIRATGFSGATITPFAYVYYGHPDLRLALGSEQVVVDLRTEDHADAGRN